MKNLILLPILLLGIFCKAQDYSKVVDSNKYQIKLTTEMGDKSGKQYYYVQMPGGEPYGEVTAQGYRVKRFYTWSDAKAYIRKETKTRKGQYNEWKKKKH